MFFKVILRLIEWGVFLKGVFVVFDDFKDFFGEDIEVFVLYSLDGLL